MTEPTSEFFQITNVAADKSQERLRSRLAGAVGSVDVNNAALGRALRADRLRIGMVDAAVDWEGFESDLEERLFADIRRSARDAAEATARKMGTRLERGIIDDLARRRAREAARLMTKNSRQALFKTMQRLRREGFSDAFIRRNVRTFAGLNRQQTTAIMNRMKAMREAGASPAQMERAARRLSTRARQARARFSARQETKIGAEAGQDQAIRQALDNGEIEDVRQRWASIRDKRRDPVCARLHGQVRKLGERFVDPVTGNSYAGPPEPHQTCRCGKHIIFKRARRSGRAA